MSRLYVKNFLQDMDEFHGLSQGGELSLLGSDYIRGQKVLLRSFAAGCVLTECLRGDNLDKDSQYQTVIIIFGSVFLACISPTAIFVRFI